MRLLIKIFALLDAVSILFMAPQIWAVLMHQETIKHDAFTLGKMVFTVLIFISLFVSATGLFRMKKYGVVTYYIQFPFRLVLWVFSIGFITFLPELLNCGDQWFGILFRICIIAEFFRCFYTVQIHRAYFR
jgi:hypothetical protein